MDGRTLMAEQMTSAKITHVIFDLFSNENYAQRVTSSVQAYFIEKTDKRVRISKM